MLLVFFFKVSHPVLFGGIALMIWILVSLELRLVMRKLSLSCLKKDFPFSRLAVFYDGLMTRKAVAEILQCSVIFLDCSGRSSNGGNKAH